MYLLDTGIVSELRRPRPNPSLVRWIADAPSAHLFLSAVTVGEIQAGIQTIRDWNPRLANELEVWLEAIVDSSAVLPMDADSLREWARIRHRRPHVLSRIAMIGATARTHELTVVTRNVQDYRRLGVACVNPPDS